MPTLSPVCTSIRVDKFNARAGLGEEGSWLVLKTWSVREGPRGGRRCVGVGEGVAGTVAVGVAVAVGVWVWAVLLHLNDRCRCDPPMTRG